MSNTAPTPNNEALAAHDKLHEMGFRRDEDWFIRHEGFAWEERIHIDTLPALASSGQAASAVPEGMRLVPLEFVQGFCVLAHNYSLRAVPPDYYRGVEGDAFSAAYRRCGEDLAKLRAMLEAFPTQPASAPAREGVSPSVPAEVDEALAALKDVADAVRKQFSAAGIDPVIGSPNPAEDLHARAVLALGGVVKREHIASAACWCSPTVEYRDPESGAAVLVHMEMQ